jgi:glutamyl-tRNA reductase
MHLLLLGVSHRTAPVELRERVDFARRGVDAALEALAARPGLAETVVLSTCNRSEVYVACEDPAAGAAELARFMAAFHEVADAELAPHCFTLVDGEVASHLFRVAAGLDSLVVGEPQILGQVKEAYAAATAGRRTGPLLNRLFHASFTVGKRVRSQTGLGEGAVSVSYAAVSLARKIFGDLSSLSVLILGAGEMAKLTAIHLQAQNVKQVVVASRTLQSAELLASRIGGTAIEWTVVDAALAQSAIVVTATGATEPVLTRDRVRTAMRRRGDRPLFVIDIALPRDVEPEAGDIDQVFLYNIDDLKAIVHENLARRAAELERAEGIVGQEVAQYEQWLRARSAVPTVVALRRRFEDIRLSELERLESKLSGLPPEAKDRVDEITHLIVEKLLLTPTEQLKAAHDEKAVVAYSDVLNRLFGLGAADTTRRCDPHGDGSTNEDPGPSDAGGGS